MKCTCVYIYVVCNSTVLFVFVDLSGERSPIVRSPGSKSIVLVAIYRISHLRYLHHFLDIVHTHDICATFN